MCEDIKLRVFYQRDRSTSTKDLLNKSMRYHLSISVKKILIFSYKELTTFFSKV